MRGLCKVVFATETLALGINMPARTVVIEKLTKFNGETHADITPGEYTQLTGRAGRRGLDVEGHAVVLWQPGMDPRELAGLASTRTYPLRSSFRPSYNMAVNLVHQFGRARARSLLEMSFAQFQADRAVVGLARQLAQGRRRRWPATPRRRCATAATSWPTPPCGAAISDAREGRRHGPPRRPPRRGARLAGERCGTGDVIWVPRGKFAGLRRRAGPGNRLRRAASLRAHRRPAGPSAGAHRLPDPGGRAGPAAGAEALQRPQPPGAARPGRDPARRAPTA